MSHHLVEQLIHITWATKDAQNMLSDGIRKELYSYLNVTIKSLNARVFALNGGLNHVHLFIHLPPDLSLSEFMRNIKAFSSKWLRSAKKVDPDFAWQGGYTAFSVQKDRKDTVANYILNDHVRHQELSYAQELTRFLHQQNISFKENFLFSSTYSKLKTHLIWSTKNRLPLISSEIQPELYSFLQSCLAELRSELLEINGMDDHVHLLIDAPRHICLSNVVKELKLKSHHWMQKNNKPDSVFEWQPGYGAFTVSISSEDAVRKYIQNQKEHHRVTSSQEEWETFLQMCSISG